MLSPSDYRQAYGPIFILETPDGTIVPWVPLSVGDYFKYARTIEQDIVTPAVLENEIFIKCVKDEVLVENIDKHKAGTVSFVADIIFKSSAPQSTEEFEFLLNVGRENTNNVIHQAITLITQAFPGYTPDDIYAMDIYTLMDRLALAERKLLEIGFLKEPINMGEGREQQRKKKPKIDVTKLKQVFDDQGSVGQQPESWKAKERFKAGEKSLNKTFIEEEATPELNPLTDEEGNTVISLRDLVHNLDTDPTIETPEEKEMLKDARKIYKDQLERLKEGQKVKIKPHNERMKEAEERIEKNRQRLKEQFRKK